MLVRRNFNWGETLSETFNEHVRKRIRDRIQEAFDTARSLGTTGKVTPKQPAVQASDLSTKQQQHYSEADSKKFQVRGDTLVGAAMQLPLIANNESRRLGEHAWYVGDLSKQPRADDLFAEAMREPAKTESKKERKKAS